MPGDIPAAAKAVTASLPVMKRGLQNRHIQMIALGGAIGTGLFYGSSEAIGMAGPSVLLAYIVGGAMIFLIVVLVSVTALLIFAGRRIRDVVY